MMYFVVSVCLWSVIYIIIFHHNNFDIVKTIQGDRAKFTGNRYSMGYY